MKNTKLIALVAVLVVVSLVVSIAVAFGNDKKANAVIEETIKNYEEEIADLNKTIEDLNKGLISATEALDKLQGIGVEIKNWNEATAVLVEKLAELVEAGKAFEVSVQTYDEKDEEKKNPLITFAEIYGTTFYTHESFTELYEDAKNDLQRATSVAEMNTILANYKAALAKVPTLLDLYIANLEAVEKDGKVTYDEYETIKLAIELSKQVSDKVYTPAAEGEEKGQKELLADRLDALMTEFKPLAVAKFVELVNTLPEVELLAPSHYEAVEAAQAQAKFVLVDLYNNDDASIKVEGKKNKATAYAKALDTLAEVEVRIAEVKWIEKCANDVNEKLAKAFDKDNLDGFDVKKYGANIETYNYVCGTLNAHIEYWQTSNGIVTDAKEEGYNAELYNLVNYSVYEGYVAKFETEVATLRAAAEAFITAVEAIENVNLDSKATLDAAKVLFDTVAKGQKIADVDTILGLDKDIVDEDGELVEEVTGVADSYKAWLTQYARYNWLVDAKKALEDSVKNALIVCTADHKDADGKTVACDGKGACENVGEYDLAKIGNFDADILEIIALYELDETVYDAELLSVYKLARIQSTLQGVLDLVDAAHAASQNTKKDTLKKILVEEIKAAAADYTFEAEFTCEYPDVKDHECNCAEKLSKWDFVIENDATALVEKYTAEILADRFN